MPAMSLSISAVVIVTDFGVSVMVFCYMVFLRKEFPEKHRPVTGNNVFPEGVDEKLTAEIIGVVADHFNELNNPRLKARGS